MRRVFWPLSLVAFLRDLTAAARQGVRQVHAQQAENAATLAYIDSLDETWETIPRDEPTPTFDALVYEHIENAADSFINLHPKLADPDGFCDVMAAWLRMKTAVES